MRGNLTLKGAAMKWPTPRTTDMNGAGAHGEGGADLRTTTAAWMTPSSNDHKGSSQPGQRRGQLSEQVECSNQAPPTTTHGEPSSSSTPTSRRRLNPAFTSWLMGWPWFWTRAEPISFAAREMELYRQRLRWHLLNLCGGLLSRDRRN